MTHAAPTHTDLKSTLEEMRASVDGEGTQKGLAGMVQNAFLKLLEVLMAMLMDFRAGQTGSAGDDGGREAGEAGLQLPPTQSLPLKGGRVARSIPAVGAGGWRSWFRRHEPELRQNRLATGSRLPPG